MKSDFVQAGPVRLQYFEEGSGPETLVLVHGYASNAPIWRYTVERLTHNGGFRIIAINNRGAGDSDRAAGEDGYTVESFADDLYNAVTALGLSGFNLVGHSMGGATVTQFALAHQDLLKSLVLLNSAPLAGRTLAVNWEEDLRESFAGGGLTQGDMGFNAPHVTQDFIDEVTGIILRNPVERAIGGRRSMSALRLRERLGEIQVPTLIVGGDRDTTVGVDNIVAEYFALPEGLRHLHMFHGIGHSPNVEVPGRFAGLLTRFIVEVNAGVAVGAAA
jgi:2-hydroxy-6-oxonona-2,4-dienedioate hydrolase/4,5:9,10-diseco-3-hydroxy-5,9,17-trioxoandrosta-1(10),2-diene-4-oate hydrolase